MITAVDTNVLLDILTGDPQFGPGSRARLRQCRQDGALVACEVVWAELAGQFSDRSAALDVLSRLDVEFSPTSREAASDAGQAWRAYRLRGGTRSRMLADFLVGAHALHQADRLLTRDAGYFRTYFPELARLDPSP